MRLSAVKFVEDKSGIVPGQLYGTVTPCTTTFSAYFSVGGDDDCTSQPGELRFGDVSSEHLRGSFVFILLVCSGMTANLIFLLSLYRNWKLFSSFPFYIIVWNIVLSNIAVLLTQIIIVIPCTFSGTNVYSSKLFFEICSLFDAFGTAATLYFNFLIALSRFLLFASPQLNNRAFSRMSVSFASGGVWLLSVVVVVGTRLTACETTFDYTDIRLEDICSRPHTQTVVAAIFFKISYWQGVILPAVIFMLYVALFIYIAHYRSSIISSSSKASDISLLAQASAISGCLEIYTVATIIVTMTHISPLLQCTANIVVNAMIIVNNSLNPILLFILSADIRRAVRTTVVALLPTGSRRNSVEVQPVPNNAPQNP